MGHQRLSQTKTAAQSHQEPAKNSARPQAHPVEDLQAAIGNRAVSRQIQAQRQSNPPAPIQAKPQFAGLSGSMAAHLPQSGTPIQAKLTLGAAGDRYEREADRIAAEVASRLNAPSPQVAGERHTAERQEVPAQQLQKKPVVSPLSAGEGGAVAPELEASIQGEKGSGHTLAGNIREPMEQAFGADFSGVKIHTDVQSDILNQSIQARAFTTGRDIFFRQGEYNPESQAGRELIAHELTHVVQQNGNSQPVQRQMGEQVIQRKPNKKAGQQTATASEPKSAAMYRMPAPRVHKGKFGAVIEDRGELSPAFPSSNTRNYLFSETAVGVQPLALIGTPSSVLDFLTNNSETGIENRIEELPHIYMEISYYQPSERFQGLFPVQDTVQQVTEQTLGVLGEAGFVGGWSKGVEAIGGATARIEKLSSIAQYTDMAVSAVDMAEKIMGDVKANFGSRNVTGKLNKIMGSKKEKTHKKAPDLICVRFHYLPEDGMHRIGKNLIYFEDIIPDVEKAFY